MKTIDDFTVEGPDDPDARDGQYLDPHAAREAIETIRNQGRPAAATTRRVS